MMEQQVAGFRQQAAAAGFSGTAILDIHPTTGIIRLKVNLIPPDKIQEFTTNYSNFLLMSLNAMNITTKTHVANGGAHQAAPGG